MSNYEIECDKCGSHDVSREAAKVQLPKKPVVKMSDVLDGKVPKQTNVINAVMTYTTYYLVCGNCGHKVGPITESNQLGTIVRSFNGGGVANQPLQVNPKSHHRVTDLLATSSKPSRGHSKAQKEQS